MLCLFRNSVWIQSAINSLLTDDFHISCLHVWLIIQQHRTPHFNGNTNAICHNDRLESADRTQRIRTKQTLVRVCVCVLSTISRFKGQISLLFWQVQNFADRSLFAFTHTLAHSLLRTHTQTHTQSYTLSLSAFRVSFCLLYFCYLISVHHQNERKTKTSSPKISEKTHFFPNHLKTSANLTIRSMWDDFMSKKNKWVYFVLYRDRQPFWTT